MTAAQDSARMDASRAMARLAQLRNRGWIGWLFILPWFVGFVWFDVLPLLLNIYLSFTDFSVGAKKPNWIGLANYQEFFAGDHLIGTSFVNTLYYIGFHVPLLIILAFSISLLLNANIRGRGQTSAKPRAFSLNQPTERPFLCNRKVNVSEAAS